MAYLQTAGQYADQFSDVCLWQDWAGRRGAVDTGIDIVATDKLTGELWAIQCKFYAPDHYLDQGYPSEPTSLRQGVSRQGRLARGRSKLGGWPWFPGGADRTVFGLERAMSCW